MFWPTFEAQKQANKLCCPMFELQQKGQKTPNVCTNMLFCCVLSVQTTFGPKVSQHNCSGLLLRLKRRPQKCFGLLLSFKSKPYVCFGLLLKLNSSLNAQNITEKAMFLHTFDVFCPFFGNSKSKPERFVWLTFEFQK